MSADNSSVVPILPYCPPSLISADAKKFGDGKRASHFKKQEKTSKVTTNDLGLDSLTEANLLRRKYRNGQRCIQDQGRLVPKARRRASPNTTNLQLLLKSPTSPPQMVAMETEIAMLIVFPQESEVSLPENRKSSSLFLDNSIMATGRDLVFTQDIHIINSLTLLRAAHIGQCPPDSQPPLQELQECRCSITIE
uniref:Uncharacterized protein n=1 Tax=Timema cristinae TaxID=61476 RepID=A0A7R9H639_TIMCR|nr:unnamed protein product [Timema cristinae]